MLDDSQNTMRGLKYHSSPRYNIHSSWINTDDNVLHSMPSLRVSIDFTDTLESIDSSQLSRCYTLGESPRRYSLKYYVAPTLARSIIISPNVRSVSMILIERSIDRSIALHTRTTWRELSMLFILPSRVPRIKRHVPGAERERALHAIDAIDDTDESCRCPPNFRRERSILSEMSMRAATASMAW